MVPQCMPTVLHPHNTSVKLFRSKFLDAINSAGLLLVDNKDHLYCFYKTAIIVIAGLRVKVQIVVYQLSLA